MVFGLKLGLAKAKIPHGHAMADRCDEASERPQRMSSGAAIAAPQPRTAGGLTVNEFVARAKRHREKGLEPTKPELIAYSRYLGIDPVVDGDLMWISEEALKAPLPLEWTEHNDSSDRVFYYNVKTHQSSWTHPLEQAHRDAYTAIVHFRGEKMSKQEQLQELERMRKKVERLERNAHQELHHWTEHTDDHGQRFYHNKEQNLSVWTDPRPAQCHELYLQMKALRVLSKHCGQEALLGGAAVSSPRSAADLPGTMLSLGEMRHDELFREKEPKSHKHRHSSKESSVADTGMPGDTDMPSPSAAAIGVASDLEDSACEGHTSHHKKRKKKRRKHEGGSKQRNQSDDENAWEGDAQKPSAVVAGRDLYAVEEVCAALGIRNGLGAAGPGMLYSSAGGGDGCLPAISHSKVRAGIKLEPLK
eukprot:gnl/TRDRNA2_/TRDRNA2_185727_c0_seq1.p1 gnl/TRDRNA2_/TRDRNA2_185727_c0~~gnl/TRDRNA2_/TRDRNA2_185727_c0_seq1.p1  ORF type:complete len:418 (-),score=86.08 gnl/TRDRNA2_/TRDRNA2_185727_c0_seq1:181-1434(-)